MTYIAIDRKDTLYNINRNKNKTVCKELAFAKDIIDRMVMIFLIEFATFSLFAMQLDYCNIQRVHHQRGVPSFECIIKGRNPHCLYIHKQWGFLPLMIAIFKECIIKGRNPHCL
jgi:hypothetical protein